MASISTIDQPGTILPVAAYSQDSQYSVQNRLDSVGFAILNDGSATTGGATNGNGSPSYLQADLGKITFVTTATFGWDKNNIIPGGFGSSYLNGVQVQGSNDASGWTTLATIPTYNSTTYPDGLYTVNVNAFYRYIRLYKSDGYIATTEFCIRGSSVDLNATFGATVDTRTNTTRVPLSSPFTAQFTLDGVSTLPPRILTTFTQSGMYSENVAATYAAMNNNSASSGYTATASGTSWVTADCGSKYKIQDMAFGYDYLNIVPGGWGTSYGQGISIQTSTDNTNWTTVGNTPAYSSTGSTDGIVKISINASARYIRLYKTSYFPVTEFALFGTPESSGFFAMFP